MNSTTLGWKTLHDAGKGDRPDSRLCPTASDLLERYVLPLASSRILSDSIRTNSQIVSIGKDDYRVAPGRLLRLHVNHPGLLVLFVRHGHDDVSYYARVRLPA